MEVNNNGAWRTSKPFVKAAGSWRECNEGFVKVGGEWRPFLKSTQTLGENEFIVTIGVYDYYDTRSYGYDVEDRFFEASFGSIYPNTFKGADVLAFNILNMDIYHQFITLKLAGTLPENFISKVTAEGYGDLLRNDSVSWFQEKGTTSWMWAVLLQFTPDVVWPEEDGVERRIVIHP